MCHVLTSFYYGIIATLNKVDERAIMHTLITTLSSYHFHIIKGTKKEDGIKRMIIPAGTLKIINEWRLLKNYKLQRRNDPVTSY